MKWITLLFLMLFLGVGVANATDQDLAAKLKDDLEFDTERRNDFKNQVKNRNVYEGEREKGLSLFLEEQEKWDLTREKGINEQRARRLREKKMDENSPEYFQDLKNKQAYEKKQEVARQRHVDTKREIVDIYKKKVQVTEEEELDIYNPRPRYALRQRGQNKWVSRGSKSGSGSSPGYSPPSNLPSPGSSTYDYPQPPMNEYIPTDNFEEIPPPPPPMPYEGYSNPAGDFNNYNNYGAPPPGFPPDTPYPAYPPPPAPEGGWDF